MKVGLITHKADVDGAFPVILSRLVFNDLEVISCEVSEVDASFDKFRENIADYDNIYVVDLNFSDDYALMIENDDVLKNMVTVFDHHKSKEHLNKYSFENVSVEEDGVMECGTTLFYNFLYENYHTPLFDTNTLKNIIELVREGDTYDFLDKNKDDALNLSSLYEIYGREDFINHYLDVVLNNKPIFNKEELFLLDIEKKRIDRYIEEKLKHVKKAVIDGVKVGIVYAEANRSLLGHAIAKDDSIDVAVIVNLDRSISYRAEKEDADVTILSKKYNGGGHKHAGGSPIPDNLQNKIIEEIYKEVEWL